MRRTLTSRWFPIALALMQSVAYIGLIAYDYWAEGRRSGMDVRGHLRANLARPLFEPSGFCGSYLVLGIGQSAVLGFDLPAHVTAGLLASAVNRAPTCLESMITPRGQLVTVMFVPAYWLLFGRSVQRLSRCRWQRRAEGSFRVIVLILCSLAFLFGGVLLLVGVVSVFASPSVFIRCAGVSFWMIYVGTLFAERLRVGPFKSIESGILPV